MSLKAQQGTFSQQTWLMFLELWLYSLLFCLPITAPTFNKIYYSHTLGNVIFSMKAMLGQTLDYIFVRPEMLKQIIG